MSANPFVVVSLERMREYLKRYDYFDLGHFFSCVMRRDSIPISKRIRGLELLAEYGLRLDEGTVYLFSEKFSPEYEDFLRKIPVSPNLVVKREVRLELAKILVSREIPFSLSGTRIHSEEFGRFAIENQLPIQGVPLFLELLRYCRSVKELISLVESASNMGDWTYKERGYGYGYNTYSLVFDVLQEALRNKENKESPISLLQALVDHGAAFLDSWGDCGNTGRGYDDIQHLIVERLDEELFWKFLDARKFFEVGEDIPRRRVELGGLVTKLVQLLAKANEPEHDAIFHFMETLFQKGAFFERCVLSTLPATLQAPSLNRECQEGLIRILICFCPLDKKEDFAEAVIKTDNVEALQMLDTEWSGRHLRLAIQNSASKAEEWLFKRGVTLS